MSRDVCHSQVYHERYDETSVSVGFWNNAVCYLRCGIFIAAIIQTCRAPVCVPRRIYGVWKSYSQLSIHKSSSHYKNQHTATYRLKPQGLIRNVACEVVENSRSTVNKTPVSQRSRVKIYFDKVFHSGLESALSGEWKKRFVKETRKTALEVVKIETIEYTSPALDHPALTWNTSWAEQRQRACLLQAWKKTEREYVTILK